ncbi:MAG: Flp pilus assembly protein CpaB [Candidatus Dormibacteria bacterium]
MSIQASKPNNRVFLLLGIVLAALAFGGVLFALHQSSGPTVSVVVAKDAIPAGTTITADLLSTVDLPSTAVPSDAYTVTSAVAGKTTSIAVGKNDAMVPAFFNASPLATTTSANGTPVPVSIEATLPKGFVALAIPAAGALPQGATTLQQNNVTPDLAAVGFYIQPGDHIDILVLEDQNSQLGTRFSFQDLLVLRTGTSGSSGNPGVYIVQVARSQAELLTGLITGQGHQTVLKYVLRPQSEWGKSAPNNAGYTPNYLPSNDGPSVPQTADTTVQASTLDNLFGH